MSNAAGNGSVASSSSASLERTLDRTIDCLTIGPQTREVRALLIEARRLRSVIANWRSIPPPADVHDEMVDRVLQLSNAVGSAFPESVEILSAPAHGPAVSMSEMSIADEDSYSLDFEPHLYSLETNTNRQAAPLPSPPAERPMPAPGPVAIVLPRGISSDPREEMTKPARKIIDASVIGPLATLDPREEMTKPARRFIDPRDPREEMTKPARRYYSDPDLSRESGPEPEPEPRAPEPEPARLPRTQEVAAKRSWLASDAPERKNNAPEPAPARTAASAAQPVARARVSPAPTPQEEPAAAYEEADTGELSVPRTQISAQAVKLGDPIDPLLLLLAEPYSPRADAYRAMRRKLQSGANPSVIGVTSAHDGEGKTVFACNFVLTMRESARGRVLLVEANLNRPMVSKLLGFTTPACFIEQLAQHMEDPRAPWVVAEPLPKLHVMAIDPAVQHEPLLDAVAFSMGMERLKQAGYEYIVIDSPAVIGSVNCNVIADACDGMIITALPMKSRRREMRKAVEQLDPAPIIGAVVLEA